MPTRVSVVMATFNGENYLREQLDSIVSQLSDGDELVVVDDGSTDSTLAILQEYPSPPLRLFRQAVNRGVLHSFERALREARNEVVFLSDQDDVWASGKRHAIVEAFEADRNAVIVLSDACVIDGNGVIVEESFMRRRGNYQSGFWRNLARNRFLGCTMAIRRSLLASALPFPASIPMHDMWLGLLGCSLGPVRYLPEQLLLYRRHGKNVSPERRQPLQRMITWRWNLLLAVLVRRVALALEQQEEG